MSYLRGPMTREEILRMKAASPAAFAPAPAAATSPSAPAGETAPLIPKPWSARWLDRRGGEIARPYLLVKYAVRYRKGKATSAEVGGQRLYPLDAASAAEVLEADRWTSRGRCSTPSVPRPQVRRPPSWLGPQGVKDVERSLKQRLPDKLAATLLSDPVTGIVGKPGETAEAFAGRVAAEAQPSAALEERISKKRRELAEASSRRRGGRWRRTPPSPAPPSTSWEACSAGRSR